MAETAAQRQAHQKYRSGQKNLSIAFKTDELYLFDYLERQSISKSDFIKKLIQQSYESGKWFPLFFKFKSWGDIVSLLQKDDLRFFIISVLYHTE